VRTTIARFDLTTPEGRVAAARAVAPMVSTVRDPGLRPEYTREVAGWLGIDVEQMQGAVARAARSPRPAPGSRQEQASSAYPGAAAEGVSRTIGAPDLRDPLVHAERQLLQVLVQYPGMVDPSALAEIPLGAFLAPAHRVVFDAVRAATYDPARPLTAWLEQIRQAAPLVVHDYLSELAVADLPSALDESTARPQRRYVEALLSRVHEVALTRSISDLMVRVRQADTGGGNDPDETRDLYSELQDLQRRLATLREATAGR